MKRTAIQLSIATVLSLAFAGAGFAARDGAPSAAQPAAPAAAERSALEAEIRDRCAGLDGASRHECVYAVLARDRQRPKSQVN